MTGIFVKMTLSAKKIGEWSGILSSIQEILKLLFKLKIKFNHSPGVLTFNYWN